MFAYGFCFGIPYCPLVLLLPRGFILKMLPQISEDCPGSETEPKRVELSAVLCEHATTEAAKSRRVSGEEDRERRLER